MRNVFTAVRTGAGRDTPTYWTASTYLLAPAIVRDKPAPTECWIMHPDPRVAFALRCGWIVIEELRSKATYPWPLVLQKMWQFHQGRLTAALPKETAMELRAELKRLVKAAGPASFDAMLESTLH